MTPLRRRHLFEFEDQSWLPAVIRDAITDFLRETLVVGGRVYSPALDLLEELLDRSGGNRVVDLCSGAGGPWAHLVADLADRGRHIDLTLTDRYPNMQALSAVCQQIGPQATFLSASVDARHVPVELVGVRTLFTAFHHLPPWAARQVLRDAQGKGLAIGVFEFTERRLVALLKTLVLAPGLTLASMRKIGGSGARMLLTYLVPIIPALVTWDALVSNLRTYTSSDLMEMTADLSRDGYVWRIGEIPADGRQPPVIYLLGYPIEVKPD